LVPPKSFSGLAPPVFTEYRSIFYMGLHSQPVAPSGDRMCGERLFPELGFDDNSTSSFLVIFPVNNLFSFEKTLPYRVPANSDYNPGRFNSPPFLPLRVLLKYGIRPFFHYSFPFICTLGCCHFPFLSPYSYFPILFSCYPFFRFFVKIISFPDICLTSFGSHAGVAYSPSQFLNSPP